MPWHGAEARSVIGQRQWPWLRARAGHPGWNLRVRRDILSALEIRSEGPDSLAKPPPHHAVDGSRPLGFSKRPTGARDRQEVPGPLRIRFLEPGGSPK